MSPLRACSAEDVPILRAQLYEDVVTRSHAATRPWRPIPPDPSVGALGLTVIAAYDAGLVESAIRTGRQSL